MHGNFYAPTVLGDVPAHAAVMSEETFGPMGALVKFSTEEEVIERANDTDVGLAGYFFSKDGEWRWGILKGPVLTDILQLAEPSEWLRLSRSEW